MLTRVWLYLAGVHGKDLEESRDRLGDALVLVQPEHLRRGWDLGKTWCFFYLVSFICFLLSYRFQFSSSRF